MNEGTLTLERVTVRDSSVVGPKGDPGGAAEGGGIYTRGELHVIGCTLSDNEARAGDGTPGHNGGHAGGGGLFSTGAHAVTLVNSTVSRNAAQGGAGGG